MKKLFDLEPSEVSLVDLGANRKKFLIYKAKGNQMQPSREIMDLVNSVTPETISRIEKAVKKASGDMEPKKDSAVYKEPGAMPNALDKDQPGEIHPLSERAHQAIKATARILAPFKDEIHDGHLDAMQQEIGIKDSPHHDEVPKEGHMDKEKELDAHMGHTEKGAAMPEKVEEEHHAAALEMAKKAYGEHLAKMGYRKYEDEEPKVGSHMAKAKKADDMDEDEDGEDMEKSVKKSMDAIIKKNADLERELKHERSIRIAKEFEERAAKYDRLGTDTKELGAVMKSLAETNPEALKKFEAVIKAANEQVAKGDLFKEYGTRASGAGLGDADAKLNALVDQIVMKDGKTTRAEAYDAVCRSPEGKKLLAESLMASQKGAR